MRVLAGWRRELVGNELCELVAGRVALSVSPDGGLRVSDWLRGLTPHHSPGGSSPASISRRISLFLRGLSETWRWPTLGFCASSPAPTSSSPTS